MHKMAIKEWINQHLMCPKAEMEGEKTAKEKKKKTKKRKKRKGARKNAPASCPLKPGRDAVCRRGASGGDHLRGASERASRRGNQVSLP